MVEKNSSLKVIKKEKLSEAVSLQVLQLMENESLKVGDRLPTERVLIQRLGVSRTAVREGMQRLEMLGIIEICPGQGTFVRKTDKTTNLILNLLSMDSELKKESLLELLELRKILEVGIIGIATQKCTQKDLINMENCVAQHKNDVEKKDLLSPKDAQFHYLIALSTHNKMIIDFFSGISDLIKSSLLLSGSTIENRIKGLKYHGEIFDALKKRDSALAMRKMSEHIEWLINITQKKQFT